MPGEKQEQKDEKGEEKGEEEKGEQQQEGQQVTLSGEQYGAMLDRIAELEQIALQPKRKDIYDIDELAEEGKKGGEAEQEATAMEVGLDDMTNTQLADHIMRKGGEVLQRIETKIETLRVMREIDKAAEQYEDFWEHGERTQQIAMANPGLSIDQAYKLAKMEATGKGEKPSTKEGKSEVLHTLPPRPGTTGEKPGVASSSTAENKVYTLKEAAGKAFDEVVGKEKTEV